MKKIIVLFFILLMITPVFAQVPNYSDKHVNDYAGVFTSQQVSELRSLLWNVDQQTTAEIVVLTVETVASMDMSQYAQEVADKWKIGKADKDNGLLILYAKAEDKIWVSTGYGLEGILPDSKIGRILDQTFVPARANGNSTQGVILATYEYADVIMQNKEEVLSNQAHTKDDNFFIYILIFYLLIFIIPIVIAYRRKHPKCPDCKGKMDIIETRIEYEENKTPFGTFRTPYYIVTYRCRKCGKTITKRLKKNPHRSAMPFIIFGGMGRGGGGFSGGGFGGGGFGGGGAGR